MAELTPLRRETIGEQQVTERADRAVGVQRRHFERVRDASLELAVEEVSG
jgi:hypothetical protein